MSTHPNAVLLLTLTPDDLSRRTYRNIVSKYSTVEDEEGYLYVGDKEYHIRVMESDYYEGMQIKAEEGDIVVYDTVTYGYGDIIEWSKLEERKNELEEWAKKVCADFNCNYKIYITANYW